MLASGMLTVSQLSVMRRAQLLMVFVAIRSLNSSILFAKALTFARKRLGMDGLCGSRFSLFSAPPRSPRRFRRRTGGIHAVPVVRTNSIGILLCSVKSAEIACWHRNPMSNRSCRLYKTFAQQVTDWERKNIYKYTTKTASKGRATGFATERAAILTNQ